MPNPPLPRCRYRIVKAARGLHLRTSVMLNQSGYGPSARDPSFPPAVGLATFLNVNAGEQHSILKPVQTSCIVYGTGI
jgi:hypothetical protein